MNTVFYGRYSDSGQSEQSIEGQRKVCYEFAERNGYRIIAEYLDRATTGTNDSRPEFQRMIADSAKRQFQAVLVYQLDRFARNRYDSATYKAKLKKNGVRVLSARENITEDASGVLLESVLEGLAEYYSAELSQKIKRGMAINAEKCLCTGGGLSLGYDIGEDKRYVINEGEAVIVRRIFEMYLAGNTMADIIRYLNENGIKSSRGNEYGKNAIRKILTNRRYLGIYVYKDTEISGGVPRIIDDDTFADAQRLMAKNKKAPARAKAVEETYLLTTKLYCGHCHAAMTGESGHGLNGIHQYYKCVTTRKHGDCKKKPVKKAYIEDLVVDSVLSALTDEKIDSMAKKISELSATEGNTDTLKRLNRLLQENGEAMTNLVKAIEQGKAVDVLSAQIEKRQQEKADIEIQLAREKMARPVLSYSDVKFFFEKFKNGDAKDYGYRSALIDTLVDRITLYDGDDPRVEIYCKASEQKIQRPITEPSGSVMGRLPLRYPSIYSSYSI